jgi:acyl-CoA thioester hydrolase
VSGFDWPVRVYYEDTDAGGVVYHAGYLRFFERGRTEWLRSLGFSQQRLGAEDGALFTVVSMSIEFRRPARLDDLLTVRTEVREMSGASVHFDQQLLRVDESGPLASAAVRVACIDAETFRPRRLPEPLRGRLG